jgi:hypothetical protein
MVGALEVDLAIAPDIANPYGDRAAMQLQRGIGSRVVAGIAPIL